MKPQQTTIMSQTTHPIAPINPETILEHGDSTAATILAVTILVTALMGSITRLVQILLWGMAQRSKPYR